MIDLAHVSKSFDNGHTFAVADVSLSIPDGAFIALVGGSGSGKTTTLKTINGLVAPDSGEVRIDGQPVAAAPPHLLRRRIGYVFQEIGLFPHLSVAENIGVTPRLLGWPRDRIAARVAELLELVSLPPAFAARSPSALSGGQRQRVGVARALAAGPKLMLMDEPFGALDPITRDGLASEYRRLHDQLGLTTIMVTHDVTEAVLLADRIVVMEAGRILNDHDPRVAALMDMPRRQAERVRERLGHADG